MSAFQPSPDGRTIRCLGCHREFADPREYHHHRVRADHPDCGEVYL